VHSSVHTLGEIKDLPEANWDKIIDGACAYINPNTGRARASSAATTVEENAPEVEDPYATSSWL